MLTELRVRDLAVIEDVTLPLRPGLNVLTGETGAGKSMLVDALSLLLGERASADVVRAGAQKTVIEGVFELSATALDRLRPPLTALGVEPEDGMLILKREISKDGRSRAWVNGSATTIGVLAEIGALLVDLHGQHETQSLLRPDAQRDILDAFGGAVVERNGVRDAYDRWQAIAERETTITSRQEDVRRKADYLRHVMDEIGKAKPTVGEDESLAGEASRLGHAAELGALARELEATVDGMAVGRAGKLVGQIERLDPQAGGWRELLEAACANLEELARTVREYASGIDSDPGRLAAVEARRDVLYRLTQKYGPTIPDVLAARDAAARELELLDTADLDLRQLADERGKAEADFAAAASALSAKRGAAALRLGGEVNKLLPALGMAGGRFSARLAPRKAANASGAEDVAFDVALNAGLEPRPLARVTSGGELSRLMLALKVVLARHDAVPTLIFDEIDQGIGGEAGARVGEALQTVARGSERQALVITHLPQIAACADHHLVVAKGARGGIATSDVAAVTGEERRREVARMLGDPDMTTALRHAAELLKKAYAKSAAAGDTQSPRGPLPPTHSPSPRP